MWDVGTPVTANAILYLTTHISYPHLDLPFDLAQGGDSFDSAQDREPVERLVEPFCASCFGFGI
jgi:hypothetical protein